MTAITNTPRWAWAWIALFLLAGSVPVVAGLLAEPQGSTFSGALYNRLDTNSYLANMQQGRQGHWLYVLPYTAERSTPLPLFLFYVLLGHVARITALSLPLVFHLARIGCAGLFAFAAYRYMVRCLPQEAERRLAFGLLLFTGGLSWLVIVIAGARASDTMDLLPDFNLIDATAFLAMLNNAHFTLSMALMIGALLAGEDFARGGQRRALILGQVCGLGIALVHANQIAVIGLVLGLAWLLRCQDAGRILWHEAARLAALLAPGALLAANLTVVAQRDPLLAAWLEQGVTLTPPIWSVALILYGPAFGLALTGAMLVLRGRDPALVLVALWFLVVLVLIYLPVNFQLRFMEGWHVPVSMLAAIGWRRIARPWLGSRIGLRAARRVGVLWVGSLALTPLFLLAQGLLPALNAERSSAYLDPDTRQALEWLRNNARGDDDVVLTAFDSGNLIPAWAPVRTTLGHWSLTAFAGDRLRDAERFFDPATPEAERVAILRRLHVDYVWVSDDERELGRFDPRGAASLEPVFSRARVQIYRFGDP